MERIIRPAVFELFLQAAADFDPVFRRDGEISSVEETMKVT
jgi:hypothetical protein